MYRDEYLTSVNAVRIEDLEGWWLSSCCKLSTSGRTLVAQARSPGFHFYKLPSLKTERR